MSELKYSHKLHVLFRKLQIDKISKRFIYYSTPTDQGESGAALMIKRQQEYYLIGLHLGNYKMDPLQNIGILFKS